MTVARTEIDPRLVWLRTEWIGNCLIYRAQTGRALSAESPYPRMTIGGRLVYLHRWVWETTHGRIPRGLCVCHRCDTPACLKPSHLFLGTLRDNNLDRIAKGRRGVGDFEEVVA